MTQIEVHVELYRISTWTYKMAFSFNRLWRRGLFCNDSLTTFESNNAQLFQLYFWVCLQRNGLCWFIVIYQSLNYLNSIEWYNLPSLIYPIVTLFENKCTFHPKKGGVHTITRYSTCFLKIMILALQGNLFKKRNFKFKYMKKTVFFILVSLVFIDNSYSQTV